jgi:hypothetical protein
MVNLVEVMVGVLCSAAVRTKVSPVTDLSEHSSSQFTRHLLAQMMTEMNSAKRTGNHTSTIGKGLEIHEN